MSTDLFHAADVFADRHIGPSPADVQAMLAALGYDSLNDFVAAIVPENIRHHAPLDLPAAKTEFACLQELRAIAQKNRVYRSLLGMGYHDCITPPVLQRNILENPGWYTQYTPYQAEISQGRLEALLNFQTMIGDLTGLPIANASLLDEATAAAEGMAIALAASTTEDANTFFVASDCHPQTIAVVQTRAAALGIVVIVAPHDTIDFSKKLFGVLLQYPATDGRIVDYRALVATAHTHGARVIVAADPLSLVLLTPPGDFGADIAIGSTQRFGVPLGYGGPHAAYMAVREELKRLLPGRLVGVSVDADGKPALRLALQTREQHIRRAKATSNICTAQVLLAVMASMYAVYHGPDGLRRIAKRVRALTRCLALGLHRFGCAVSDGPLFDTVRVTVSPEQQQKILTAAAQQEINLRMLDGNTLCITLDEVTTLCDVKKLWTIFAQGRAVNFSADDFENVCAAEYPAELARTTPLLTHPVFHQYHSETEMLRYLQRLQAKDLSLTTSMIPLGSCTMKLNATAEMFPVTWPEFGRLHPFAPVEQAAGYTELTQKFAQMLCTITGFPAASLQPNAGSQGEYAGLLVIRAYHAARGDSHRTVCLIPASAHGTNPASAVMAGMTVVGVACDNNGNVDLDDLRAKVTLHEKNLAAFMVTYPSTHGVFEEGITEMCDIVHAAGGQVYMDGANLNAQVGVCRVADFGPDVCHINLHKTFCIPHGGGGPGMGPICVAQHLAEFLPSHPMVACGGQHAIGAVSAAPWGSASILPISYAYIAMMGADGLQRATAIAMLNANYIAHRLNDFYPVLFRGRHGHVAHECIIDVRPLKVAAKVEVEDVAKRLMDYGFHAPTMSWPIAGTLMIEPTESESKAELDRFCDAMIAIHAEARAIADGKISAQNNMLKNAPHTAHAITAATWDHPYSRAQAAFPAAWLHTHKYWPPVSRINNPYGDRNLVCSCPPVTTEGEYQ